MSNDKKVKSFDGKILDIIEDVPNSIQYDRLLNGRAPVQVQLNGSTVSQYDIINFILPSGSTITDGITKTNVNVVGITEDFIFRPGGTPVGNVYTNFVSLYTDLSAVDGPTRILFDNSISAINIPLGTYDFSNTILDKFISPDYPLLGDPTSIVPINLSIGTVFSGNRLFVKSVRIRSLSSAPIMSFPINGGIVILQEGAEIEAGGAYSFAVKTGTGTPMRVIMMNSKLKSSAFPVFECDGTTAEIDFYLFGSSIIENNTLKTNNALDVIKYFIFDTSVEASTTQASVITAILVTLESKSTLSFYDNTIVGLLSSTNVQDAIDELAGMTGGSGFQNEFIYRPSGVASGNIYTNFTTLYAAHNLVDGPKIIYFDDSLATTTIPSGTYDFSNTLLTRFISPMYPSIIGDDETIVECASGVTFTGDRLFVKTITLKSLSPTAIMTFGVAVNGKIILQEGAQVRSDGGDAFFYLTGDLAGSLLRVFLFNSKIKNTSFPVFEVGGAYGVIDFHLFGSSIIEYDTIETGTGADLINYFIYDTSVEADTSQSLIITPVTVSLESKSNLSFYDNTITGLLSAVNVQDAIDEIAGMVGGAGLVPQKDTFVPIAAQTIFTLSFTPGGMSTFLLTLNGLEQEEGINYTVSGTTLTWLNFPFVLAVTDLLIIHYFS